MRAYRDQYAEVFNNGRDVVLIGISVDPVDELASWQRDEQFPFLMASDASTAVGQAYGALAREGLDNRNLYVIGPDGRIEYTATPFRQVDPQSYTELAAVIDRLAPAASADGSP